jgi:hypothetical protein
MLRKPPALIPDLSRHSLVGEGGSLVTGHSSGFPFLLAFLNSQPSTIRLPKNPLPTELIF